MTGGRLKRVAPYLDAGRAFCMTYGDGVGDVDITALLRSIAPMVQGDRYRCCAAWPLRRARRDGKAVTAFMEKPPGDGAGINGGFFVLEPAVLDRIAGDATLFEREPLEGLAADGELMAFDHSGFWRAMDTIRDRNQLEQLWSSGNAPWKIW